MPANEKAPNITHAFEQYGAIARDWAGPVGAYFDALIALGFTREEALALTINWQTVTLTRLMATRNMA